MLESYKDLGGKNRHGDVFPQMSATTKCIAGKTHDLFCIQRALDASGTPYTLENADPDQGLFNLVVSESIAERTSHLLKQYCSKIEVVN